MKLQLLCLPLSLIATACGPAFSTAVDSIGPTDDGGTAIDHVSGMMPGSTTEHLDGSSADSLTADGSSPSTMGDDGSPGPMRQFDGSPVDGYGDTVESDASSDGAVCTPLPNLPECNGSVLSVSGSTVDNHDPSTGQCVATATPSSCRCRETYTCWCVLLNSHSCANAFGGVYVNTTCTMQSNGVPLVSCQ